MKNSKIASIVKSFSKEDFISFEKFMKSPFFPSRRDITGYYKLLKKYHNEFNISKEDFFKELFPGLKYNERKMKNLTQQMVKLAEDYLVFSSLKKNERMKSKILATEYITRQNDRMFERTIKGIETKNINRQFDSGEAYSFEQEVLLMKTENYNMKDDYPGAIKSKMGHTDYLTASFIIKYLRALCDRDAAISYNIEYETPLIKAVFENTDFEKIISSPELNLTQQGIILNVYYRAYKAVIEYTDKENYYTFKKLLYDNITLFTESERFLLFNDLTSCCWNNRSIGNHEFGKEQMMVYKDMMRMGAWRAESSGYLTIVLYRNIIFMALILREYGCLEGFIKEHSSKMNPEFRENMENFAWAHLYFETGQLEDALKHSSKVKYDFFVFKLDIKHLLLKIYYELNLFDHAYSLSDTYKHFLKETKEISDTHKVWHDGFIAIYMKMLRIKSMEEFSEIENLKFEYNRQTHVISKSWVNSQIQKLEENKKGA
jgi:hypothetical protein